jgi:cytochrome c oxidase subunit 2
MKTLFKLAAIAAAFGLAPAATFAATATAPAPVAANATSPAPSETAATSNSAVATAPAFQHADPTPGIGQPDGRWGLQDQVSPIGHRALWFHNMVLMPLIIAISLFVLALLFWVVFRYRRRPGRAPSRNSHNTTLEILWTLIPVLILVAIAVPSISLLRAQYSPPRADLTIKVVGNQWFWEYQYPDHGVNLVSNMLDNDQADANHEPRQLAADERMVVPVGATVKLIVTSNDVIHAFGVPAFWTKIDAVPGRLNETWFSADRPGVYYGVCYELCGARHGYMPIAVEVVTPERFAQWIASKGGHMPGAAPAASAAAPAANNSAQTAATPAATTNQAATR